MNNKKGAMFGLDARIALAIFGALSVISGAALYSAIQNAKVTAVGTEMQEVAKAYEQYYLDTGVKLEQHNVDSARADYLAVTSGHANWSGPYVIYDSAVAVLHPKNANFGDMYIKLGSIDADWDIPTNEPTAVCNATCYVWVEINGVGTAIPDYMYEALDEYFDGEVDADKGRLRFSRVGSGHVYLAIMPYK
tara:strand:- start:1312 stop:1887 length:576 start_codon:yes stop_codon:yes gene_type:complete